MIIDLKAEMQKRINVKKEQDISAQKKEAIQMLEEVLDKVKASENIEEMVIAYKSGDEYKYHCNSGSSITFVGMLELVKKNISDGI